MAGFVVAFGSAWARAMRPEADIAQIRAGLTTAATNAPKDIKKDFDVVVSAQLPFLDLLDRYRGNQAAFANDPAFQTSLQALANPKVALATASLNRWFAVNCGTPR